VSQNRILRLLDISKGTLYYKKKGYPAKRSPKVKCETKTIETLKSISITRPTYGCPRLRAIAKRDFGLDLTRYKVYRLARENGLLLTRSNTRNPPREHTGRIAVQNPNTRWASDITQIRLWDGTRLRFAVILDCCDRSVIAYRLGRYIWGADIEEMMQEALITRFGKPNAPSKLQFLHDNGPEYLEKEFQKSLKKWNVEDCRTPTYSPQSNGMCESFNCTFKRDYVYQNCLENEEEVRDMIDKSIKDYNTFAPHSALDMMAPLDYFRMKTAA